MMSWTLLLLLPDVINTTSMLPNVINTTLYSCLMSWTLPSNSYLDVINTALYSCLMLQYEHLAVLLPDAASVAAMTVLTVARNHQTASSFAMMHIQFSYWQTPWTVLLHWTIKLCEVLPYDAHSAGTSYSISHWQIPQTVLLTNKPY